MQISFRELTPLLTPKTPQGEGGYGTPYRGEGVYRGVYDPLLMGGVFKGHMGPPSYVVHVWVLCQDKLISKYIGGNLSTDNMTNVEKYWGECLVVSIIIRIFVLTLWSLVYVTLPSVLW
jgi:hypothetical protein